MNKILSILAITASAAMLTGCDDYDDRYTEEYSSVVRLDTYGEQDLKVLSTNPKTNYSFKVMRSGHSMNINATATIHAMTTEEWAEYANLYGKSHYYVLPSECYKFDNTSGNSVTVDFNADTNNGTVGITFDNAKVGEYVNSLPASTLGNLVCLPITLETNVGSVLDEQKNLLIMPQYEKPSLKFNLYGFDKVNCMSTASPYEREYTVTLSCDNTWGFTAKVKSSQDALDLYNTENGTQYSLMQPGALEFEQNGEWQAVAEYTLDFPEGTNTASFKVRINPSKAGMMDAMALIISDPSIEFDVTSQAASNIFAIAVKPSSRPVGVSQFAASTQEGSNAVKNLYTTANTYYSSITTAHDGDPVYGSYVDMKLSTAMRYLSFDFTTRNDTFGDGSGVPNVVDIYVSTDGAAWEKCGTIEGMRSKFTGANQTVTFGNFDAGKSVNYIRWAVIKGGANGSVDHREQNTTAYWCAKSLLIFAKN